MLCNRQGFKNNKNTSTQIANNSNTATSEEPLNDDGELRKDSSKTNSSKLSSIKRKRVSTRIGCKARVVSFKYAGLRGYVVSTFEERHNHCMSSSSSRQFLKVNRNLDLGHQKFVINCAKANIGTMKCYKLFKESVGGYSNIEGVDAQMLLDKLFRKREVCSAFSFEYDVDESDQLTRLFWADPISRKNYSLFGDIVSFDATYGTNRYNMVFTPFTGIDNHKKCVTFAAGLLLKEDVESYAWLFTRFLDAMGHKPNCIVTDQDPSMRIAIQQVFTGTPHRYCMWHIMKKVTSKVGPVLSKNVDFMKKLNSVVWSHYLEPDQFEKKWALVMEEFELTTHKWFEDMYALRKWWIPAYFRDLFLAGLLRTTSRSESENNFFGEFTSPHFNLIEFYMQYESAMDAQRHTNDKLNAGSESYIPLYKTPLPLEKHASQVYTLSVFYDVQDEICSACFSCRVLSVKETDGILDYVISDDRGLVFNVDFSLAARIGKCSCKYFQRLGLVCSHMFVAFKDLKQDVIPDHFVLSRWCKAGIIRPLLHIGDDVFQQSVALEEKKLNINHLWSDIHACVAMVENHPAKLQQFSAVIKEQKDLLLHADQTGAQMTSKKAVIQSFYGSAAPSEVLVLPPQQAKNKGSGKRIKGAKEVSIEESKRPKRLCRSCNEMIVGTAL